MAAEISIIRRRGDGGVDFQAYPRRFDLPVFLAIEARVEQTQASGRHPLWQGYAGLKGYGRDVGPGAERSVRQVRSSPEICRFYAWLVTRLAPETILEVGAAFGVSGMYWLAGLEAQQKGHLHSFEPNPIWAEIARENFAAIGDRASLHCLPFEEGVDRVPKGVGLVLIDAIHTRDFVLAQYALARGLAAPGAVMLFDDIDFSAEMRRCWAEISAGEEVAAAWEVNGRLGVLELR